jgi:hypothetical protein
MDLGETFFFSRIRSRDLLVQGVSNALQHCCLSLCWTIECIDTWICTVEPTFQFCLRPWGSQTQYLDDVPINTLLEVLEMYRSFHMVCFNGAPTSGGIRKSSFRKLRLSNQIVLEECGPIIAYASFITTTWGSGFLRSRSRKYVDPNASWIKFCACILKPKTLQTEIHCSESSDSAANLQGLAYGRAPCRYPSHCLDTHHQPPTMIQYYIACLALKKNEERKWYCE